MSHVYTGRCVLQRDRQRRQSHIPVAPELSYRRVAQFPMKGRLTLTLRRHLVELGVPEYIASDCFKGHKDKASCST